MVFFRVLRHFTHKASVTSVNAEANVHSADWLMSIFVNELAQPHVRSQQDQCVQQCRRIMEDILKRQQVSHLLQLKSFAVQFLSCMYSKMLVYMLDTFMDVNLNPKCKS